MSSPASIVIIGTGLAGYQLAKEFRKHDTHATLTLLTRSDGYFYSKPLLSTALTHHKTPDELAIIDVEAMRSQLNAAIITQCDVYKIDADHKKIIYRDNKNQEYELRYDKLILANGAKKVKIPLQGSAVDEMISVNQLEAYRYFRKKLADKKHVAILGSGLVGCEFANDLLNAGLSVSMISLDNALLQSFVPKQISDALQGAFEKLGLQLYLNKPAQIINKKNNEYEIILSDGQKINADLVLSAVGIRPDLTLAQSAGLRVNVGVVVNSHLQTSDPDIYALGDCAEIEGELKMYVAPILQNARILAMNVTGEPQTVPKSIMPIVIKTPACPIVCVPPSQKTVGEWRIEIAGLNNQALFYDNQNKLRGFALSGDAVKDRMRFIKQMSEES